TISGLLLLHPRRHRLLEVLYPFPQPLAQLGDAAGSEDEDEDHDDQQYFLESEAKHDFLPLRRTPWRHTPGIGRSYPSGRDHAKRLHQATPAVALRIDEGAAVPGGEHRRLDGRP